MPEVEFPNEMVERSIGADQSTSNVLPRALRMRAEATAVLVLLMVGWIVGSLWVQSPIETAERLLPTEYSIDLNRATGAELQLLPGVGEKLASDIVRYRQEHAGFQSLDELKSVRGIKEARYRALSPYLTLNTESGMGDADRGELP